jgi:hypothetical protein
MASRMDCSSWSGFITPSRGAGPLASWLCIGLGMAVR